MTATTDPGAPADRSVLPVVDLDPYDTDVLRDPRPMFAAVRDAGPLVHLSAHDVLAVARYDEVREVLCNWQGFASGPGVGLSNFRFEKPWRPRSPLLEGDPPHHDAPRRVLSTLLGPRVRRRWRAAWTALADDLVDRLLGGGCAPVAVEAMTELIEAFSLRAFPDAVGIPDEGRENLVPFSDFLLNAFGPRNELVRRGAPRARELGEWVNRHCAREALADEGLGADIWAAADRGEVTGEQAHALVRSLFAAGVDTTVQGLAGLLLALAADPEQWQLLRARPELARTAFDEAVRWSTPSQMFFRTAMTDVPLGGGVVPDGRKLLVLVGAANRDPRRWDAPERFDLLRDPSGHLAFGFGLHQCVGQHIARLEAECLLGALLRRVERIEPAGPALRKLNNSLRAWETVPLRLHPTP